MLTDKDSLRRYYKDIRNNMSLHERRVGDLEIFHGVAELDEYKNSSEVLVYVSSAIEVDTYMLIDHSIKVGKIVLAPRCLPNSNDMEFFEIKSLDDLENGTFGIYEPNSECLKKISFDNACCIVPALSYNKRGYRLGFGKGFYDKFLSGFSGAKIGICYECCMSDKLPNDEFDINVDVVVTDKSAFRIETDQVFNKGQRPVIQRTTLGISP